MELIIFIGLQGSGKSTFYARNFADSHIRLNLDMLKTRHRERVLMEACLEARQPVVVDNTNPTPEDRARYIAPAAARGFRVVGYYFQSKLEDCKVRNERRALEQIVRLEGVLGTYNRLVLPRLEEGFDRLHYVHICADGQFNIQEWSDEI